MISDDLGKQLHDKATRGKTLSPEEVTQLEMWYEIQDKMESELLNVSNHRFNVNNIQSQIEIALKQLTILTKRIQEIATENETLRQEIITLRNQLAYQSVAKPIL